MKEPETKEEIQQKIQEIKEELRSIRYEFNTWGTIYMSCELVYWKEKLKNYEK